MSVNKYFQHIDRKTEQDWFEQQVIESIQFNGVDIYYIPLENFEIDPILGEPTKAVFEKAFKIEAYIDNGTNFGGEQNLMSKFGFRINQTTEFHISKKRFSELGTGKVRPMEGDLIYIGDGKNQYASFANAFFEINQVWYETPEWQFGKHFVFRIVAESYTYSYEKIRTGVKSVDAMQAPNAQEIAYGINDEVDAAVAPQAPSGNPLVFDEGNPFKDF